MTGVRAERWWPLARAMTEDQLLDSTIDLARALGWLAHHCRPARTGKGWRTPVQGDPGFPDLILVRDGWLIAAELKSQTGRVAAGQAPWVDRLDEVSLRAGRPSGGLLVYVWRPVDWYAGTIRQVLDHPAGL
jgi:hypothetical protein